MISALSLVFLYFAIIVPTGRLAVYFLSSVFIAALVMENELGLAVLSYVVTSLLAMLLVGLIPALIPYLLLFGHYGIGKALFERMHNKAFSFLGKFAYFNVFLLLTYLLAKDVLLAAAGITLPVWLLWLLAQVVFVVYDTLFTVIITLYNHKIRRFLLK